MDAFTLDCLYQWEDSVTCKNKLKMDSNIMVLCITNHKIFGGFFCVLTYLDVVH